MRLPALLRSLDDHLHPGVVEPGGRLGAQAGDAPLRHVVTSGGFTPFGRATETLFNIVLEARS